MALSPGRRVALSLGVSTAMVVIIAAVFPRIYLANDDIGFTEYLRKDMYTPWISPILARGFGLAYLRAPDVPWYGLYQYAVIIATGAVLIHTCMELVDRRPGVGRIATLLGALVLIASHAILVVGITWTTVSISAIGTATAAFIAHLQICQAAGTRVSRLRALVYALLFVSGYMLRLQGLGAVVVALFPLTAWGVLRFIRRRHFPGVLALVAMAAPFVLVVAIQDRIPQAPGADRTDFNRFNHERGKIHGHTAFEYLDKRGPELLERTGWTLDEYRDFTSWLIIDEEDFPLDKVERLLATGGVPEGVTAEWAYDQLRGMYADSAASILLLLSAVIAGVVLAFLGTIRFWHGIGYCLGYLVFVVGVPLWMAANFRFPQRVSLSFFTVAALGVFVFIARAVADRPAESEEPAKPSRRATIGLIVVAVFLFGWARELIAWIDRAPWPDRKELQALEDRVVARDGFVFVFVQAGLVELDPLRAEPRSYDGLQGGWGTFSAVWYDTIARLGVKRGADVLGAMVDRDDAYLLSPRWARGLLTQWIRRKSGNENVRLALVDGAAVTHGNRPELYRLVTKPLERGSEEWKMLERDEVAMVDALPGPPSVSGWSFHPVAFTPPFEAHVGEVRYPAPRVGVESAPGGIKCTVVGEMSDGCMVTASHGSQGGVHIPLNGLRAAKFTIRLIEPDNIVSLNVHMQSTSSRSAQWRWDLSPQAQQLGFTGTFTLVPGHGSRQLGLHVDTAKRRDLVNLRDLRIYISVKPGTQAGFELTNVQIAPPAI